MQRKFLIHAGMMKTGSTSIQYAWQGLQTETHAYLDWHGSNQSGAVLNAFGDEARRDGSTYAAFTQAVEASSAEVLLLSAEVLTRPGSSAVMKRLVAEVAARGFDTRALVYVRPALSYLGAVFLQRLQMGLPARLTRPTRMNGAFNPEAALGREAVELRLFDRTRFAGGDVISDASTWAGLDRWRKRGMRNESPSLDLAAILYLHGVNTEGGATYRTAKERRLTRRRLLHVLGGFGNRRFRLAPSPAVVTDRLRRDVERLVDRVGPEVDDLDVEPHPDAVRDDAALIRMGESIAGDFIGFLEGWSPVRRGDVTARRAALDAAVGANTPAAGAVRAVDELLSSYAGAGRRSVPT